MVLINAKKLQVLYMLYIDVPYAEKEMAKELGAKWDKVRKSWYVENLEDYYKFGYWILSDNVSSKSIVTDYVYLVLGQRECWKCHKNTTVLGFTYGNGFTLNWDVYVDKSIEDDDYRIKPNLMSQDNWDVAKQYEKIDYFPIVKIPNDFCCKYADFLQKFNFKQGHSKTTKIDDFYNHCQHCNSVQGDNFLYYEYDSPFILDSEEKLDSLSSLAFKLENHILADIYFNFNDSLIMALKNFRASANIIPELPNF